MDEGVRVPELEYVGTYEAMLEVPLEFSDPFGRRQILEISGGRHELLSGGGDWLRVVERSRYGGTWRKLFRPFDGEDTS